MVLVKPQCQTSVTKSGTDGSPELAGVQGTKWHSTTGPDGPMRSLPFLLFKRRKTAKAKEMTKTTMTSYKGGEKHAEETEGSNFPPAFQSSVHLKRNSNSCNFKHLRQKKDKNNYLEEGQEC